MPPLPSIFTLYATCVQAPAPMARFLLAVHGGRPRTLREDFCGGGAICAAWARLFPRALAIAVDSDPKPLRNLAGLPGIQPIAADVLKAHHKADIISATNFPLGYWHTRDQLVRYLTLSRKRLRPKGVFIADTYGGPNAFRPGSTFANFRLPDRTPVRYEWEQRDANPITARVHNAIHFTVGKGRSATKIRNAFTYDWRLWSLPELADAYREAGFRRIEIYDPTSSALDHTGKLHVQPITDPDDLAEDYVVCVVGRK